MTEANNEVNVTIIREGGVKRDNSIDIAKGITMLMVIWMHCTNNLPKVSELNFISSFISVMYMPCFFLISGFFIKNEPYKSFLSKKIKTLLWPLLFVYVLSFVFALTISHVRPDWLKNEVCFWNIFRSENFTNGPIWFLSALFLALNITHFILRLPNVWIKWIIALSVCATGFYWRSFSEWRLPLFFDTGLTAVGFVFAGSYIRKIMNGIDNTWMLLGLTFVCYVSTLFIRVGCSMQSNAYSGNLLMFIIAATAGSTAVLALSKCINHNQVLQYIGRNSLIVLCFHMFVIMGTSFIIKKVVHSDFAALVICFAVTTVITTTIIPIIKKTLYFVFK